MKLPSQEQIDIGNLVTTYCYDLSIYRCLGGDKPVKLNEKLQVIGDMYLKYDIDVVTAIYLAMSLEG